MGGGEEPPPKKEVVPSDLISSLALYRHARHGALRTKAPDDSPLCSPMAVFSSPRINASWLAALLPLVRNRSLVTAFRWPATAATFRRPPFRGQSSQPATSLPSRWLPCPFGLRLHYRLPDCAGCGRFIAWARCTSTIWFGLPRLPSPLPFGIFTSLGIKAFNGVCCLPVRLTNPPDFLSLPAARPDESLGRGSSFQVR